MQNPLRRTLLIGSIVFPALLVLVNLLFALFLGGLPNIVKLHATLDPEFLHVLWQDNPWETVKLVLIDRPLGVAEKLHHATGVQVWGMFYFAGTILVYLLVTAFTVLHWKELANSSNKQRVMLITGVLIVLIGVTYLRRAECCTSGPAWVLETWLLAKAYMPKPGVVDWMGLYQRVQGLLPVLQAGVLTGGVVMLYRWRLGVRSSAISVPGLKGS